MLHYINKFRNMCCNKPNLIGVLIILIIFSILFLVNNHTTMLSASSTRNRISRLSSQNSSNRYKTIKWTRLEKGLFGYSAYWDSRIGKHRAFIRVISIVDRNRPLYTTLKCRLKMGETEDEGTVLMDFINEHHGKTHAAIIINCIPRKFAGVPEEITIFSSSVRHWIPIQRVEPANGSGTTSMVVCVRPLFGPYNQTHRLAEFLSFYQAVGVSHFAFYDLNITEETKNYLLKLSRVISLDLLPWNIPLDIMDTWAYGQLASIQDCIYRYMYLYEYVLFVDIDEYVVPKYHYHLRETLEDFTSKAPTKSFGAFIIRNTFYCVNEVSQGYVVLNNTKRQKEVWPAKLRSKIILKPETVMISGIHSVQKMFKKWLQVELPIESVVLHHYRNGVCNESNGEFDWKNSSVVEDKSALKYKKFILNSIPMTIWKDMFLL